MDPDCAGTHEKKYMCAISGKQIVYQEAVSDTSLYCWLPYFILYKSVPVVAIVLENVVCSLTNIEVVRHRNENIIE